MAYKAWGWDFPPVRPEPLRIYKSVGALRLSNIGHLLNNTKLGQAEIEKFVDRIMGRLLVNVLEGKECRWAEF